MATYTENYNLTLPEEGDFYNVENFNENFETIDTLMAEAKSGINEVNEKIGTPENGETVFSLLKNNGGGLIKSIQTVSTTHNTGSAKETILAINAVDPTRCIVLMDRMSDTTNLDVKISYTLAETSLTVNTGAAQSGTIIVQFQIIEFN